jgi:hypothetical protein
MAQQPEQSFSAASLIDECLSASDKQQLKMGIQEIRK